MISIPTGPTRGLKEKASKNKYTGTRNKAFLRMPLFHSNDVSFKKGILKFSLKLRFELNGLIRIFNAEKEMFCPRLKYTKGMTPQIPTSIRIPVKLKKTDHIINTGSDNMKYSMK